MIGAVLAWMALMCLFVALVLIYEARREHQRRMRERLGRFVGTPQRLRDWTRLPKNCELCGRPMDWPAGMAKEITPDGEREIFTCSVCLADPMLSLCSAAAETENAQHHPDEARPDGPFSARAARA